MQRVGPRSLAPPCGRTSTSQGRARCNGVASARCAARLLITLCRRAAMCRNSSPLSSLRSRHRMWAHASLPAGPCCGRAGAGARTASRIVPRGGSGGAWAERSACATTTAALQTHYTSQAFKGAPPPQPPTTHHGVQLRSALIHVCRAARLHKQRTRSSNITWARATRRSASRASAIGLASRCAAKEQRLLL